MIATKEQELKALDQIRKIVDDLGDDSYIKTAFEGCFEMAEQNIEYDFGLSWKREAEDARNNMEYFKNLAEENKDKLDADDERIAKLEEAVLSRDDLTYIMSIIDSRIEYFEEKEQKSAADIVEFCEDTDSEMFRQAVDAHRFAKSEAGRLADLLGRVSKAREYAGK